MEDVYQIWALVVSYNGYMMLISASGFLLSLVAYIISENKKRAQAEVKSKISDEKSFFGHFDEIENPAFKIPEFSIGKKTEEAAAATEDLAESPSSMPLGSILTEEEKNLEPSLAQSQAAPSFKIEDLEEETGEEDDDDSTPDFMAHLEKQLKASLPELPKETQTQQQDTTTDIAAGTTHNDELAAKTDIYEYDDEERKVKSLLEQIKKDMREQGDQTS